MTVTLPLGAEDNIPEVWKLWDDEKSIGIVFPSTSGDEPHVITFHKSTRVLSCDCIWSGYGHDDCRHAKLVCATLHKNAKKRKKGVQDTSRESYWLMTYNDLSNNQQKVYDVLCRHGPKSNKQVSAILREESENKEAWPINTITPRMGELYKMGFVEDAGRQYDPITKRQEIVWRIAR